MVLYKRKPIKFDSPPPFLDDQTDVWAIEETGEVYIDYDKYLTRREFYDQKSFTCESTGHQQLTFFEALDSEEEASKEINSIFPEGLRPRVLDFVQFKTTPRMDDLVNNVFDHFREHYMVGDKVSVEHDNARRHGTITKIEDTSRLHGIFSASPPEGAFRSFTYHITVEESGEQLTKYKASELQRDRRVYSKIVLKQFLRSAISREPWNGAPWKVKDHLAKKYDIPTTIPEAKTRKAIQAAKKAAAMAINPSNTIPSVEQPKVQQNGARPTPPSANGHALTNIKPPHSGHGQNFVNYSANPQPTYRPDPRPQVPRFNEPRSAYYPPPQLVNQGRSPYPPPVMHSHHQHPQGHAQGHPQHHPQHHQQQLYPPHIAHLAHQMPPPGSGLPIGLPFQNNFMQYQALAATHVPQQHVPSMPKQPPFVPIKYPIDDLEIKAPLVRVLRPPLKFFCDDVPEGAEPPENKTGILMKSVGPLLCAWETLNVHDTIYALDSFTLDDFVGAMSFSSEEVECELLTEVHCAVLKQIVNESGRLQAPLPKAEESDEEDEEDSSKSTSPDPEPEPEPPARTTRSSLRKSEASSLVTTKERTPTPEPPKQMHQAAEFLAEFNWVAQLKIRDFRDGGWQAILVGLLHQLAFSPVQKEACDKILAALVPPDEEPSLESIALNYAHLDVNLRICALDMALQLTVITEAFRDQLAQASVEMTRLRKEKIEHQKRRKELADELFKLDTERKILLPSNMPASPTAVMPILADVSMTGTDDGKEGADAAGDSAGEPSTNGRKTTRHTKTQKRKREADEAKKEKAKKAKIEAAKTKQQQEWEALLNSMEQKKVDLKECEANIQELDDDLRETLVARSKVIGKDRFLNKYYWFEHNGMPFGGVPNSSTAEYGYANGRLWVQGPDKYELQPNLEEPAMSADRERLGYTVPERKEREEGNTHLSDSTEWGYYDDPTDLDKLLGWLDDRGLREKALRKELVLYRERIAEYMVKMKEHLSEVEKSKTDDDEDAPRVSTRTKTYVDKDVTRDRCLLWTNSIMRSELGYSHAEEYEPPRKTKKGTAKVVKTKGKK